MSKQCTKCRECKPMDDFGRHPATIDGRQSWCKACDLAQKRQRYSADPAYRAAGVERVKALRKRRGVSPPAWQKWLAIAREEAAQP